jgi:hypothetical protein
MKCSRRKGNSLKPTHASIAVAAAVLAVAALAVPAAEALSQKSKPAAHRGVAGAQAELRATRATLARATSQLARIRGAIGSGAMQQEASELLRTLNKAKAQLHAAQVGLRGPSPLAVAVEQVRREVAYVQGGVPRYSHGQLIAEAAMDYVAGHVSDTAYGYIAAFGGTVPRPTANISLSAQAGICTGAAVTFAEIVHHFGFAIRSVNFYYDDPPPNNVPDGHVAVEVAYDGGWHFFDPTFGLFWTDTNGKVLSTSDVRAGRGSRQKNAAAFTNVFEDAVFGDDSWFITDPATRLAFRATKLIGER